MCLEQHFLVSGFPSLFSLLMMHLLQCPPFLLLINQCDGCCFFWLGGSWLEGAVLLAMGAELYPWAGFVKSESRWTSWAPTFTKLHRQKINALDGMGEVNLMFFRLYSATTLEVCELNSHLYQQLVCLFGNVLMPVSNPSNYYSAQNVHWVIQ